MVFLKLYILSMRMPAGRFQGWWLRLADNEEDGSQSILTWECGIPGPVREI